MERCFILGNGPSLNDINLGDLNRTTFGSNRIYLSGYIPDYYLCVNPLVLEQFWGEIAQLDTCKFIPKNLYAKYAPDNIFGSVNPIDTSYDLPSFRSLDIPIWEGHTVTYVALQVAYYMGFTDVTLLGVDHDYGEHNDTPNMELKADEPDKYHFHPDYFGEGVSWHAPDLARSELAYSLANQAYKDDKRTIVNASTRTKLDIFPLESLRRAMTDNPVRVSAIVSAYKAKPFMEKCLDDLINQTEIHEMVFVCQEDSFEYHAARDRKHNRITIVTTPDIPTVFNAWTLGIKQAIGKYVTYVCTDDLHHKDAFKIGADILDARDDIDLVYHDQYITWEPYDSFEAAEGGFYDDLLNSKLVGGRVKDKRGMFCWPEYNRGRLFQGCYMGPQPMWRTNLHQQYGYFDENLESAGDYEMWLRVAKENNMLHIPYFLGLYHARESGVELSDPDRSKREVEQIWAKYKVSGENKVYFSVPMERAIQEPAANALMGVCLSAGRRGYARIQTPYARTDTARNKIVKGFMEVAKNPNDMLVMLDADHEHPYDIVETLASTPPKYGVVGALAFVRGGDHHPVVYIRKGDNYIHPLDFPENTLLECSWMGTAAMGIRRWVFDELAKQFPDHPPFFRIVYDQQARELDHPGEDWYFGTLCQAAGIPQYVLTSLETPHLAWTTIGKAEWDEYYESHKDDFVLADIEEHNPEDVTHETI